jgi:hypothetical protein
MTEREDYRMEFKITTAGVVGLVGATVIVVLLALLVGVVWSDPPLDALLLVWFGLYPSLWAILVVVIRAWLIYKWVVR